MASVLHKTTKQYLVSVNTPDYLDGNWLINPDLSAVEGQPLKYWIIENDAVRLATTLEQADIDDLELYSGLTVEQVKTSMNARINEYRDNYIDYGIIYLGYLFDADERARENVIGITSAISLGVSLPPNFTWRSKLNEDVPMSVPQLVEFGTRMLMFVSACYSVSWYHKDTMNAMVTTDHLDIINYNFQVGWPDRSIDESELQSPAPPMEF